MQILITGGAGFVGSRLALLFRQEYPDAKIVIFDNLHRRGSELNLPLFRQSGIEFCHGDIRLRADLEQLSGNYDLFLEASAEPSVHAGTAGQSPRYLLDTNLLGTLNCLDFALKCCGGMVFLSTSRVYAIPALRKIQLRETETRFEPGREAQPEGFTAQGITERFPVIGAGFRSLYGASKLASELVLEEYAANYDFPVIINRCGVIAGAGQFGKTDQGVFTLWVARHAFGGALSYTGFGGTGKQVRDLLHPRDLFALLQQQLPELGKSRGEIYGVGGGLAGAVSLREYTRLCAEITGRQIEIRSDPTTAAVDVPYYVTDHSRVSAAFGWQPAVTPREIVREIAQWLQEHEPALKTVFA